MPSTADLLNRARAVSAVSAVSTDGTTDTAHTALTAQQHPAAEPVDPQPLPRIPRLPRTAGLKDVLDAYMETGSASARFLVAFRAWAKTNTLKTSQRGGWRFAKDERGQIVAAASARAPSSPDPLPTRPCATCGAAPAGTFQDGSPRYRCTHAPLRPRCGCGEPPIGLGPDGTLIYGCGHG